MRLGEIIEAKKDKNIISVKYERAIVYIELMNEKIIRFFIPDEQVADLKEFVIPSALNQVDAKFRINEGKIEISTNQLTIKVFKDFKVDIYDNKGNVVCRDYREERCLENGVDDESKSLLKKEGQEEGSDKEAYEIEVVKCMEQDEYFYGLGDKIGTLNKKGYDYVMWNTDNPAPHVESFKSLYKSIPFLITLRKKCTFGIFFNNSYKTYFDLGKENTNYYYFAAHDGKLDYYFIYGEHMKEVITQYTELTGRAKRPPMWSLGYHQSRWGYRTEEEVEEIGQKFRELEVPCDAIHLDLHYMEGCRIFTWNKKDFSHPELFNYEMQKLGFHVVPIIDPGIKKETGYKIYDEVRQGEFCAKTLDGEEYTNEVWPGTVVYPNFFNEQARKWWGEKHEELFDLGIVGIWNDMNEPASFNGDIPDDVCFDIEGTSFLHKELHNVYGHFMAKATYEAIKTYTHQRPFIVSRACFSGTQKYAAVWTGDNHSIWAHLQTSIAQLCNLGLSGFTFSGCDVGGYGSDTTKELLIRWYQAGCFYPFFRNHNTLTGRPQEPWAFDEECLRIIKKYIELRYQLLPYIYDCFIEEEKNGLPVMRPLVLEYQDDSKVKELNDEFMIGNQILVAPIVEQGKDYRAVYLPKGEWIDYWNGEVHQGEKVILRSAPLDTCPIYIKTGSIIPMYDVMQYVGEKEIDTLTIKVYGQGEYVHIQDNGIDFAYEEGEYNAYSFEMQDDMLTIRCLHQGYSKRYKWINIEYEGKQKKIELNSSEIKVKMN